MSQKARTYAAALRAVLADSSPELAPQIVSRFHRELKRRGDLRIAGSVLREFETLWAERNGTVATAITAEGLTEEGRRELERTLAERGYQLTEKRNPEVSGGVALFLGSDYLIDNTVKGRMGRMWRTLSFSE